MIRIRTARASLLAALLLPGLATAAGLNDTGITQCAAYYENNLTCPQDGFPLQDAETGRDAQQTAGSLSKAGGGSAGFDFTKLGADGNVLAIQNGTWDAEGSEEAGTKWSCVRDNVTGLIWEIKTDNDPPDLHDKDWTYTWYNSDPYTNGSTDPTANNNTGNGAGSQGDSTSCGLTLMQCNTEAYAEAVNAAGLCGYSIGWRMPTMNELLSIVDYSSVNPAIDVAYFPNTPGVYHWSASPSYLFYWEAWGVDFTAVGVDYIPKSGWGGDPLAAGTVRLVRGGE